MLAQTGASEQLKFPPTHVPEQLLSHSAVIGSRSTCFNSGDPSNHNSLSERLRKQLFRGEKLKSPRNLTEPGAFSQEVQMNNFLQPLWSDQQGQDIAEYAVMLAVILVLVVGTIRLVGSNANNVFSSVASSVH